MPVSFSLGHISITPGALTALRRQGVAPETLLDRHTSGDWGDIEVIGEYEPIEPVYEAWYWGRYPEPVYRFATGSVDGRNRLRAEQRQRAGLP
jgi:hypothetical protein